MAWWFLVFDSPAKHPRISPEEREYILDSLGQSYTKEKVKIFAKRLLYVYIWDDWLGTGSLEEHNFVGAGLDEYLGAVGRDLGVLHADDSRPQLFQVYPRVEHSSGEFFFF